MFKTEKNKQKKLKQIWLHGVYDTICVPKLDSTVWMPLLRGPIFSRNISAKSNPYAYAYPYAKVLLHIIRGPDSLDSWIKQDKKTGKLSL